jgi:uncharacterized membrane protein YkvA (DUF1232 family)
MIKVGEIRSLIEEAKATERTSGVLYRAVIELARQNGMRISALEAGKVIDFATDYIEQAPALISAVENAVAARRKPPEVQPLLNVIEDFFLAPDDIIPDHLGLAGLLDDAYLAHKLLAAASDALEEQSGKTFLPKDAARANRFIRRLIGEPFATILDEHVEKTIENLGGVKGAGRMLIELAEVELSSDVGSLRWSTRVTEIIGVRV